MRNSADFNVTTSSVPNNPAPSSRATGSPDNATALAGDGLSELRTGHDFPDGVNFPERGHLLGAVRVAALGFFRGGVPSIEKREASHLHPRSGVFKSCGMRIE